MRLNALTCLSIFALTLGACATTSGDIDEAAPPPPPPPPSAEASTGIVYTCANGTTFNIYFSENAATVTLSDGTKLLLPQQVAASGIWYSSGRHDFRGKGRNATWTVGKMVPTQCVTD